MIRFLPLVLVTAVASGAWADPPPPANPSPRPATARVEVGVALPPVTVPPPPRLVWAPAPQPTFGQFSVSADFGGGWMTAPDGSPLSGGGWELGLNGAWGPTRFAELRLRASFFDQVDRSVDTNGDQQDDVDERNLIGMFLGGGLRLRLPLYTGIDEGAATRVTFFTEGLAGFQPLFSYGDLISSGPAFEFTNGVLFSHVRRRDGLTRGIELFVRYRQGLGGGNRDLSAVILGLGYTTEWSAFVPRAPAAPVAVAVPAPGAAPGAVPGPGPGPASAPGAAPVAVPVPAPVAGPGPVAAPAPVAVPAPGAGAVPVPGPVAAPGAVPVPVTPRGEPLSFSLRMGGEGGFGQGWHVAKTVGWAPSRFLELQLLTSYFSIDHSEDQTVRDEPNVQGFFGGVGPRAHVYVQNGLRIGLWAAARFGWAQVVSEPDGRDGSGLALQLAVGASFGGTDRPYSTTDVSLFIARQIGLTGNDDDIGMLYGGLAFDFELGPHALPPPEPEPAVEYRPEPIERTPYVPPAPGPAPEPVRVPVAVPPGTVPGPGPGRSETDLVVEVSRPARPWPVGFAIGAELGWSLFPQPIAGFRESGLGLGLGLGFVASPYFEIRSRVGLLTRADAAETDGDDIEAVTLTAGPRLRLPIRTVKDHQIALIFEALGGWLSTSDPAGSALGSGPVLEGAVGVRLPARGGLLLGARALVPLEQENRGLLSVQFTLGGEFEMGPRFRHPMNLPEAPRVHRVYVPTHVEMEVR